MSIDNKNNFEKNVPINPEEKNKIEKITDILEEFDGTTEKAKNQISKVGEQLGFEVPEKIDMGKISLKEKIYFLFAPLKTKLHSYIKTLIASGGDSTRSSRPVIQVASGGDSTRSSRPVIQVASGGDSTRSSRPESEEIV